MVPARLDFPSTARLHKPGEFKAVFERGSRHSERWLTALILPNALSQARLGLAVSRKSAAEANSRNRIKRQIRESFRQNRPRLPPVDIVILSRPGSAKASAAQLRANLDRLWTRIVASFATSSSDSSGSTSS